MVKDEDEKVEMNRDRIFLPDITKYFPIGSDNK
jgi:hypothetical protein